MLIDDGIVLFKFWINIGREMQLKRFHERRLNPLDIRKLAPADTVAGKTWTAFNTARAVMPAASPSRAAPWTGVQARDKRRRRLAIIRCVLAAVPFPGRDDSGVRKTDPLIVGGFEPITD